MTFAYFFSELRRRNVLRAGAFYAAAGWLLVQIATQVFPCFDIPNWTVRLIVIAVVAGFPFALAFSWFYALTVVALIANSFVLRKDAAIAVTDKSIEVLPFENLSEDKANAYFADGIQDEIPTRLAKIGALKVISRTSTRQYAAKPGNLPEIARQLGVANVLEGSVQKVCDAVRITVQLIRAASDEHLWAESYGRKLDDIFGVEGEVAQSIATALEVTLSGGEEAAQRPIQRRTTPTCAGALESRNLTASTEAPRRAADLYADAVRLDPGFAPAWAHLAMVKSYMYGNQIDSTPGMLAEIKQAADTALRLQPELGEAHLALGYYRYRGLRDFEQARLRLPNNADVLAAIGYIERRQGKWADSTAHLEQAVALASRDESTFTGLAMNCSAQREFAKARATLDRALDVEPDMPDLLAAKAGAWLQEGSLDEADALLRGLSLQPDDDNAVMIRNGAFLYRRDFAAAIAADKAVLLAQSEMDAGPARAFYLVALAIAQQWSGDGATARENYASGGPCKDQSGRPCQ